MAPKVTIVVPVYNGEQFLPACIESICAQTWTDFECVMVNDGSSDGSGAICDEVSRRDSRFRVIHQENGGLSRARNAGMRVSRGEYYLFLDADDTIHPRLLELALKEQAAHPQSLITWKFTHDLSEWNSTCFPSDPSVQIYGRWDLLRFFADRVLFNSANNKLYPRELIEKHALWFDPAAGSVEDYVFFTAFWKVFLRISPTPISAKSNCPSIFTTRTMPAASPTPPAPPTLVIFPATATSSWSFTPRQERFSVPLNNIPRRTFFLSPTPR